MDRTKDLDNEFVELAKNERFRGRPLVIGDAYNRMYRDKEERDKGDRVLDYMVVTVDATRQQTNDEGEQVDVPDTLLIFFIFSERRFIRIAAYLGWFLVEVEWHPWTSLGKIMPKYGYPMNYDHTNIDELAKLPAGMMLTLVFNQAGEPVEYRITADLIEGAPEPYKDIKQLIQMQAIARMMEDMWVTGEPAE